MAKYTVRMSCGHDEMVELFGKESDRQRKIEYFESSGLCKECYKKKMQEQNQKEGLMLSVSALPYIDEDDGDILLSVWFSGDTRPYKDGIKSLGGYRWSEREAASDFLSLKGSPMCWNKIIKASKLGDEIEKAESIGAKNITSESDLLATASFQMALKKQNEWKEKNKKILDIEKPNIPTILKGHRWNQKIYGKEGNYSVYLDGEKAELSDKEAKEIKAYLVAKSEYKKKVEEIKNV